MVGKQLHIGHRMVCTPGEVKQSDQKNLTKKYTESSDDVYR